MGNKNNNKHDRNRKYSTYIKNTVHTLKVVNDITNALDECIYQVFDLDGTGNNKCLNCSCK